VSEKGPAPGFSLVNARPMYVPRQEETRMTKIATSVIYTALLAGAAVAVSVTVSTVAAAADKAPAPAAGAAPAGPPAPAPEVDALFKGYAGVWKCESTFAAGAFGPGTPEVKAKSEVKIAKDIGGFWYKGDFKIKKTKTMPALEAIFLLGWDAVDKAPISVNYDSAGGFSIEHGPGSTADKITFTGDSQMMGMKTKVRETMTKKDDKNVVHTFEIDMGKGFQPMTTDECKKSSTIGALL
jgi:hypothetical protein